MKNHCFNSVILRAVVIILVVGGVRGVEGQISQEEELPSSRYTVDASHDVMELPSLDNQELKNNEEDRPGVYLFGHILEVDIGLKNSGHWTELPDGGRLWRTKIVSSTAHALRFMFDDYDLPVGGQLFIHNPGQDTLGAFTAYNNSDDGKFATDLIRGNVAIIEYYEPAVVNRDAKIHIYQISHAYRDPFGSLEQEKTNSEDAVIQGFGDSGSCQINAVCASSSWDDARDATVQLLSSNSTSDAYCSGVMLNNTNEDYTPYLLTAKHCLNNEEPSNTVVRFNYQSPFCNSNIEGPTDQSISGTTSLAEHDSSDFKLLELDKQPIDEYGVYLAGWDRSSSGGGTLTAIFHHPLGDIKKFAKDNSAPQISDYAPSIGYFPYGSHWKLDLDKGATNNNSSGAPYFNYKGQVIGQHHGTTPSFSDKGCDYTGHIYGGRLTYSWDIGSNSSGRLKDWLDPYNNNPTSINGIVNDGPPKKPTNLYVAGTTNPQLNWDHDKPADFDHYKIFRNNDALKSGVDCGNTTYTQFLGTSTSKSFTDTEVDISGVKPCIFAYYVIAVDDNSFESPPSNLASTDGEYIGPNSNDLEKEELANASLRSYPNPFNPSTTIKFTLRKKAEIKMRVFNTNGRQVKQLINGEKSAGSHQVKLSGDKLASGIYMVHFEAHDESGITMKDVLTVHLIK